MTFKSEDDRKKWWKQHYENNKEYYRLKSKNAARKTIMRVLELKSKHGCECGENNPLLLDFHHINGDDKLFSIAQMRLYSWSRILSEIKKCVIMCIKCHRLKHIDPELIKYVEELIKKRK